MKNNPVNPKRLKKGVIYKYTRRILGIEYWEFITHHKRTNPHNEDLYMFKQVHGKHFHNGFTEYFDSIDIAFYMFYVNKEDRKFLNRKMKK